MNIVISAHFDLARPVMSIKQDQESLSGLVDNFAGMFVTFQASRKTGVPVYYTNYEELEYDGAIDVAQSLDKKTTLVIVVDTILEKDISGKTASITNVYNLDTTPLKNALKDKIHFIDGYFEETEDETWIYGKRFGFKTLYFGVPIPNDYHTTDNRITLKAIDEASKVLTDLILNLQATK
jgi:hypothetical protein